MASAIQDGQPAPADGALPPDALAGLGTRPFGVYVHVPFCATRCGYCDFNTYTAAELGSASPAQSDLLGGLDDAGDTAVELGSASPAQWLVALRRELDLAGRVLGTPPPADTVFVGGGTPSLLGVAGLSAVLDAVRSAFGLASDAEVTTEANPESTYPAFFAGIRDAGYTRVSLGMQSVASQVLAVLDRTHTPGRPVAAAREARDAGFEHVNLDLIYGTPGERRDDLAASLDAVLDAGVDHVSAYALIVEEGTALARRIRRGELAAPDDDVLAERYLQVDAALAANGLHWYEVSNWARGPQAWCRHNLGYWYGADWWGAGPGAHSHVGNVRWWNVKHPARYAHLLAEGASPAAGREVLSTTERHLERVMLQLRLSDGLIIDALDEAGQAQARAAAEEGLLDQDAINGVHGQFGRCVLTTRGRLLADAVIRRLT